MCADGEGLLNTHIVVLCASKPANVLSEVTPYEISAPYNPTMIFFRAHSICLPYTFPVAGHPGSSLGSPAVQSPRETQFHFQVGRRGCAEGSVMGGRGRDKHNPHRNSVNPSYHVPRADNRQEPAEM